MISKLRGRLGAANSVIEGKQATQSNTNKFISAAMMPNAERAKLDDQGDCKHTVWLSSQAIFFMSLIIFLVKN